MNVCLGGSGRAAPKEEVRVWTLNGSEALNGNRILFAIRHVVGDVQNQASHHHCEIKIISLGRNGQIRPVRHSHRRQCLRVDRIVLSDHLVELQNVGDHGVVSSLVSDLDLLSGIARRT